MRSGRLQLGVVVTVIGACSAGTRREQAVVSELEVAAPVVSAVEVVPEVEVVAELPAVWPEPLRWIAAGGGGTPEFNQVSIEQDLGLARETFGTGGLLLFAGGRGSHGVQVQVKQPQGDALLRELANCRPP